MDMTDRAEFSHESLWEEDSETGGDGVVEAISSLKAYCMAAKKNKSDMLSSLQGKLKNSAIALVDEFGEPSKKDIVTNYAQVMGKLKVEWAKGLGAYVLNGINSSVMGGKSVIMMGSGENQGYFVLDHTSMGLRSAPAYFKKLRVSANAYGAIRSSLHQGATGAAMRMFAKSGVNNAYKAAFDKLKAKYLSMMEAQNAVIDKAAKVSITSSFTEGIHAGKGIQEVMEPLPPAGAKGGAMMRAKPGNFKMPTDKEISKEAMKEAEAYMKKIADADSSPDQVIDAIETELEGTTIKIKTGSKMFGESYQSPTVVIEGTLGTIKGTIDALPLPGRTLSQTFKSKGIGDLKSVVLTNDKAVANPWLVSGFHVRTGFGNPWVEVAPEGRAGLMDQNFWLDGSKGEEGPFYQRARQESWTLLPTGSVKLVYKRKYVKKEPICATITCINDSKKAVWHACEKDSDCDGFTYSTGLSKGGFGCTKRRCHDDGASEDAAKYKEGQNDYFEKRGFGHQDLIKHQKAKLVAKQEKAKKKAAKKAAKKAEAKKQVKDFKKEAFKKDAPAGDEKGLEPKPESKDEETFEEFFYHP